MKKQYTCSMHPEIVSDKPGKCPKCGGMDLVEMGTEDSHDHYDHHDHASMMATPQAAKDFLKRFWTVTILLIPSLLLTKTALDFLGIEEFGLRPYLQFGLATVIFYFGLVFFEHAMHEIKARKYGMMTLVSLAVGSGYLFSAASTFLPSLEAEFYLEISTLIWVLLFGHYLEARSSMAAGDALREVEKLLPKRAHLLIGGVEKDVGINDLKPGDVVMVKPGEKVPADGIITKGGGSFNESLISGESKPVQLEKDSKVIAGSICINSSVEVKLMRVGENSTIGQIKKLIAEAKLTKPTTQAIADKAAGILTFVALTVAIIALISWSFIFGESLVFGITIAITVLVIACPHALGLAIPTVSTITTKLAIDNGLFIKDMKKLEVIRKVDYVVFDKTGTLTKGEFGVVKIDPNILTIAASLEKHSSHVIGLSIVKYAKQKNVKFRTVTNFKNIAGKGVEGRIGDTDYYLGRHEDISVALVSKNKVLGEIVLKDEIKPESRKAIEGLHKLGVKIALLTGDSEKIASKVSKELNIDEYFSEVLPKDKYKHIKQLQSEGNIVLMVGDGVNDAPALTQADVGVAIGAGTDVAVDAGDVVLTKDNPEDVIVLIKLSKIVYRKMIENLVWALGYNVVAIPAAAGLFIPIGFQLRPEIGAFLMSMSSVIVVANAMTLKRVKFK